jgi:hypothetical protein
MFAQATVLINRQAAEVYNLLADIRMQIPLWGIFAAPGLQQLEDGVNEIDAYYNSGSESLHCLIIIHLSRPGAGLVTRVQTACGEMAAEWRIIDEDGRTRVEVNIEGLGGGPTSSINVRQVAPRLLAQLKQHFEKS